MCFDSNINGIKDVKFLDCDYLLVQQCLKLTSTAKLSCLQKNNFGHTNSLQYVSKYVLFSS